MKYKFKYRRKGNLFWKSFEVIGHLLETRLDRQINPQNNSVDVIVEKPSNTMVIYFDDGSLRTIPNWSDCELILGTDWKLAQKKQMESEIGQDVKLNY